MRKIIFVKECYIYGKLHRIVVRYTDDFGRGTASYDPSIVPKYVYKFMDTHSKQLFSTQYDKHEFGIVTYIYRNKEV